MTNEEISGGNNSVGTREGRLRVAAACGFLDARFMVYMMETHGYPLPLQAIKARKHDLKIDYLGLRHELEMMIIRSGSKKDFSLDAELSEVKLFYESAM